MLERLRSYLQTDDLHDPFVRLESISFIGDGAELRIGVLDDQREQAWSHWAVTARGLRDCLVPADRWGDLHFEEGGHVLARQHVDPTQELYFRGTPRSAPETVG